MFSRDNSALIVLSIVVGALVLWYILGQESCEACYHECSMSGSDNATCAKSCAARGLKCPMELELPTEPLLSPGENQTYVVCMKQCRAGGGSVSECIKDCSAIAIAKDAAQAAPEASRYSPEPAWADASYDDDAAMY